MEVTHATHATREDVVAAAQTAAPSPVRHTRVAGLPDEERVVLDRGVADHA